MFYSVKFVNNTALLAELPCLCSQQSLPFNWWTFMMF